MDNADSDALQTLLQTLDIQAQSRFEPMRSNNGWFNLSH
jgi:hypothetical protein